MRIAETIERIQAQVDSQSGQLLQDLMAEIEKVKAGNQNSVDAAAERLMNMVKQVSDTLSGRYSEL